MSLIKISNLKVRIDNPDLDIIDDVSMEIPSQGYTLGIVGESGSGKTTLVMSILRAIEPPLTISQGTIEYDGNNVLEMTSSELRRFRWKEVAAVPQAAMNSLNPLSRMTEPILEVISEHSQIEKAQAKEVAEQLLSTLGIPADRIDAYPHELSGGMKQRVMIALALALSPKVLIADEPTSALDVVVQKQLISLLKREIKQRKLSLIYVTHEIAVLSGLVDNLIVMYRGEVVEQGPINTILSKPLHPYSQMLLRSMLTIESSLESSPVDLEQERNIVPKGAMCKYSNRCKHAFERCFKERPKLIEAENSRLVACHLYN